MSPIVFIAGAPENHHAIQERLVGMLQSAGAQVLFGDELSSTGVPYRQGRDHAVLEADVCLAAVSPAATRAEQFREDLDAAFARKPKLPVIPVQLEPCSVGECDRRLAILDVFDLWHEAPAITDNLRNLIWRHAEARVNTDNHDSDRAPADSILMELHKAAPDDIAAFEEQHQAISLKPGNIIAGRFEVIRQLGAGGMGAVYLVTDKQLQEKRALKVMLPALVDNPAAHKRFLNEIRILQRLSHDAVVRVHDLGVDEQRKLQFFTMEYIQGETLHRKLANAGGQLPAKEVIQIAIELCEALEYAHEKTIHRDLKPANIMTDEDGRLRVLDFGLAKLMTTNHMTMTNAVMGTFQYQSPEQRFDPLKVDQRTDIFALGVMMYEMLTGTVPTGNFEPPSALEKGVPKKLDRVVMRCLENRREQRYQDAAELRADLEALGSGSPLPMPWRGSGIKPGPTKSRADRSSSPALKWAAGIAVAVAIALAIATFVYKPNDNETPAITPPEAAPAAAMTLAEAQTRAEELHRRAHDETEASGLRQNADRTLSNAQEYRLQGDTARALVAFQRAIEMYEGILNDTATP